MTNERGLENQKTNGCLAVVPVHATSENVQRTRTRVGDIMPSYTLCLRAGVLTLLRQLNKHQTANEWHSHGYP